MKPKPKTKNENDLFELLRKLDNTSNANQRILASRIGFSLGKINYCLKELKKKGLIKIKNFQKNPNKLNYIYLLTPKGIKAKTEITYKFMRRKMVEYEELQKEYKKLKKNIK
tara:strand:- start:286 stop:621 length:336 start_codon:yes stop_codon:yes gene_type:complete